MLFIHHPGPICVCSANTTFTAGGNCPLYLYLQVLRSLSIYVFQFCEGPLYLLYLFQFYEVPLYLYVPVLWGPSLSALPVPVSEVPLYLCVPLLWGCSLATCSSSMMSVEQRGSYFLVWLCCSCSPALIFLQTHNIEMKGFKQTSFKWPVA